MQNIFSAERTRKEKEKPSWTTQFRGYMLCLSHRYRSASIGLRRHAVRWFRGVSEAMKDWKIASKQFQFIPSEFDVQWERLRPLAALSDSWKQKPLSKIQFAWKMARLFVMLANLVWTSARVPLVLFCLCEKKNLCWVPTLFFCRLPMVKPKRKREFFCFVCALDFVPVFFEEKNRRKKKKITHCLTTFLRLN